MDLEILSCIEYSNGWVKRTQTKNHSDNVVTVALPADIPFPWRSLQRNYFYVKEASSKCNTNIEISTKEGSLCPIFFYFPIRVFPLTSRKGGFNMTMWFEYCESLTDAFSWIFSCTYCNIHKYQRTSTILMQPMLILNISFPSKFKWF